MTVGSKAAWIALLAGALALLYVLWPHYGSTELERRARAEGRIEITYWDRHAGHEHEARVTLIQEFNESQDEIYVRAVPIGYNALMEKTLTSIAGSAPADICSIDGGMLSQLASQGLFFPLDELVAQVPALAIDNFLPHIRGMMEFDGHVWAIPTTTDTMCLLWNKGAFRKAGLDPERPPKTLEELEEYAARLTVRGPNGAIEQMGFLPWLPWDLTFMWGALFGGRWYDDETKRVEASSDPSIVASLAWQQSFTRVPGASEQLRYAMDPERIAAFSKGIGDYMSANNPFYSGKVAMIAEGEWQVTFIPKYAPGLDWGVAPLPQPEGVSPVAYGPTCVSDAVPATARNPEAAMKFLAWFYSPRSDGRPSPASDYCYAIHNIPPRRSEAMQDRFMSNPKFRVFVEELLHKPVAAYPVAPVSQYILDHIERQRERVTFRKVTPEEAARDLDETANRELDRVHALLARRRS